MARVWIEGRLVEAHEATVAAVSPGVQVGLGVFESLGVVDGVAFALTRHLARLYRSAAILGIEVPVEDESLRDAVAAVLAANPEATKVRITVSDQGPEVAPAVVVDATAQQEWPETADVVLSPFVRNESSPLTGAKSTSYAENLLARRAALRDGADEALLCDSNGFLSEGTASNVFVVVDGRLCTPSLANGALGGMTRELLLEVTPVEVRADITVEQLRAAPEVFITSSTRGVHPVATIDAVAVPSCPGPLTEAAADAYAALRARTLDP